MNSTPSPARPDSPTGHGYSLAVASSLASAAATVVGKWNLEAVSPLLMNSLIFTVATIIVTATTLPRNGIRATFTLSRRGWFWLLLFAASSWLAVWAFWAGVQLMDPSLAAFLNRTEVLVAILLGVVFLKERFTKLETFGVLLAIIGVIVMRLTLRVEYSTGFWLVLVGSLLFGVTEFVSKMAVRYVAPITLLYIRNLFLAVVYWMAFASGGLDFSGLGRVWPGIILLGILGPILARFTYLKALRRLALSKVAVITQSQPVFVIAIALLMLGQLPTLREMLGGLLLTSGCVLLIATRRNAQPSRHG